MTSLCFAKNIGCLHRVGGLNYEDSQSVSLAGGRPAGVTPIDLKSVSLQKKNEAKTQAKIVPLAVYPALR